MKITIVGAGLAGLIAAHHFVGAQVVEAAAEPREMHKALLRFRSRAVEQMTGIKFKPVTVRKGIWHEHAFHQPNISLCNQYTQKCLRELVPDRSIWNLDPVERYIAPDDFYWRMLERLKGRVHFGEIVDLTQFTPKNSVAISTAPLWASLSNNNISNDMIFKSAEIHVVRVKLEACELYQTVYFPAQRHNLYRASITGSTLILEFMGTPQGQWAGEVLAAFGLLEIDLTGAEKVKQSYGKISPVDNLARRHAIAKLSQEHGVYSLGRFATWRNILLDDVVKDIHVIDSLLDSDHYAARKKNV